MRIPDPMKQRSSRGWTRLRIATIAGLLFTGCTPRAQPIVTISQSQMNETSLKRVVDAGTHQCANDDGLHGIRWSYDTLPGGVFPAPVATRPSKVHGFDAAGSLRDAPLYAPGSVSFKMLTLAEHANRRYEQHSVNGSEVARPAQFVCGDGVVKETTPYRFSP